jgi:hypothetical protein
MFRAIGTILLLLVLARMFDTAFVALEDAAVSLFDFIEVSANVASLQVEARQ